MLGAVAQLAEHLHGMQGVRGSNPLSSTRNMDIEYIKKIFFDTKELFTAQFLIAMLSLIQVSYVVKQLGAENYGAITLFITFTSLFYRGLHSKNSDVVLIALNKENKNIFSAALLFDFIVGLIALTFCLTIYFTPYIAKFDIQDLVVYFFFYLVCRVILNFSETSKAILINSGKLKLLSYMELSGTVIRFVIIISFIYTNPSIQNYLLGQSLYMMLYGVLSVFLSRKQTVSEKYDVSISYKEYWHITKSTYKKIRYDQIIGLIPQHFDILLLSAVTDLATVGIYKFAKRLVEPINYIVAAFNPWIQNQYSSSKKIDFSNFVKKLLLPLSALIILLFIFAGAQLILLIGSSEFVTAYEPLLILAAGYIVYLLTFWIRQSLLFNDLITYHAYGRIIHSLIFVVLAFPLTNLYNSSGLALALSFAILFQKIYEYFVYKTKISPKSIK